MIQERLGIEVALEPTDKIGQFDIVVDDTVLVSRGGNPITRVLLGAGFPDPEEVLEELARRAG